MSKSTEFENPRISQVSYEDIKKGVEATLYRRPAPVLHNKHNPYLLAIGETVADHAGWWHKRLESRMSGLGMAYWDMHNMKMRR